LFSHRLLCQWLHLADHRTQHPLPRLAVYPQGLPQLPSNECREEPTLHPPAATAMNLRPCLTSSTTAARILSTFVNATTSYSRSNNECCALWHYHNRRYSHPIGLNLATPWHHNWRRQPDTNHWHYLSLR
jgi:hypothetical protein